MRRFFLFLFASLAISISSFAATVDLGEVSLGKKYNINFGDSVVAVLHVQQSGILRAMCNTGDYLFPYRDAERTELLDHNASFYDGAQGYVIKVQAGDVIYFMRSFCMNDAKVWFEMQSQSLTYTSSPAVGQRLVPTGRAQLELDFNMPVVTSGGTMTCGGQTVNLEPQGGSLYLLYEIKDIVMRWIESGIKPGTPIDVKLLNVHAAVDESIKCGSNGTLTLRYQLPDMPGKLVSNTIENLVFKSYWLDDDEEGVLRMTFSKPVSQTNPGYLSIIYGNAEAMDVNQLMFDGKADGNSVVYDLRGINLRPKDILDSGNVYPSILVRPGGVYDSNGELMYSPGMGTIASWTFDIPYVYLQGSPSWEVSDENENDIVRLNKGDGVLLYVYYYNLVRSDGILLTFSDGQKVVVPLSEVEVNWETNETTAELFFEVPDVDNPSEWVTISFANMRNLTGAPDKGNLTYTVGWTPSQTTGVDALYAGSAVVPAYDLSGRRVTAPRTHVITIEAGKKKVQ